MATYYCATTGNDGNAGTFGSPWLSWHYAMNRLSPGDILYIRGGTYTVMYGNYGSNYFGVRLSSAKSGSSGSHITVSAYNNEVPILDCTSLVSATGTHTGVNTDASYWDFIGLTVQNVAECTNHVPYDTANGWGMDADYVTFTKCVSRWNGGGWAGGGDYVYWNYCDAYENNDVYDNGGYANGWSCNLAAGNHVFWTGCRAWSNSDDGYDLFGGSQIAVFDHCWAFENGGWNGYFGNGAGFKTGAVYANTEGVVRTLKNCLSFNNTGIGFDESQDPGLGYAVEHLLYNNTSYGNDVGFNFQYGGGEGGSAATDTIRNNISHNETVTYGWGANTVDHNSWNGHTVTDGDFLSVVSTGAKGARGINGELPILNFLKLVSGSDLIDVGVDVGIAYSGTHPDLGAYEFSSATIPVTAVTVSGVGGATAISTDDGTLQMLAHIDPHDATNQTVVWSVIPGTGTASIDSNGLLTALTDGTVTVKATANG